MHPTCAELRKVDSRDHGRLLRIFGEEDGDRCGISVVTAQMTGSPTLDVLVGSDLAFDTADNNRVGRVDIFDGDDLIGRVGAIDLRAPFPAPAWTLYATRELGDFGSKITVGDFDGDALNDVAIAAPRADTVRGDESGAVYLFFGSSLQGKQKDVTVTEADVTILGMGDDELTGQALESGDFDNDGKDELVVSATRRDDNGPGTVFVVRGRDPALFAEDRVIDLFLTKTNPPSDPAKRIQIFTGEKLRDRLGESLAVGDIDGNGSADLFIGADHADVVTLPNSTHLDVGRVYLFHGETVFTFTTTVDLSKQQADFTFTGKSELDLYGDGIHLVDWDGLQGKDLWIGAPFAEPAPLGGFVDDRGILSMVSGGPVTFGPNRDPASLRYPIGTARSIIGPMDADEGETLFGGWIQSGDFDSTAAGIEIAVSASRFDDPDRDNEAGLVTIFNHSEVKGILSAVAIDTLTDTIRIAGEGLGDRFGFRTARLPGPAGDLLVVSAPFADAFSRFRPGVVYIFDPSVIAFPTTIPATPTFVPTLPITLAPTPTRTITNTPDPPRTPTVTQTPTPTNTPIPEAAFDVDGDGSVDAMDLVMFSRSWMGGGNKVLPTDSHGLIGLIGRLLGSP